MKKAVYVKGIKVGACIADLCLLNNFFATCNFISKYLTKK
jgi:hypothetical protein